MAIIRFTDDETTNEEITWHVSGGTMPEMKKAINTATDRTMWYTRDNNDVEAVLWKVTDLEIIKSTCDKRGWRLSPDAPIAPQKYGDWRDEPATDRQTAYLHTLKVDLYPFGNITKGFASQLIDAAKTGNLGSVMGAFYTDGSN
jgi:hypothetical protein